MQVVKHRAGIACLCALNAGCALTAAKPAAPELPPAFQNQPAGQALWPGKSWYDGFGSAELSSLLAQAAGRNLDLTMARARLAQADARARQAGAAILPSVDAGGNANFLAGHSVNGSAHETDWSALVSASYEVDFWGKNRAAAHAAQFLAAASRADRDTLALTTSAGVANTYFQVLSLRERLLTAQSNVDAARGLLAVIKARFDAGMANPVELAAQKAVLANAALAIPALQQQEGEALAALALLVGRAPEGFTVQARSLEALSLPAVAAGLPSDLLTRRPDIFMAEANMQAAHADLVAARAALYPSLSLTASGGVQNPAVQAAVITLSGVGPGLNIGTALVQTIFDGGRLRAIRAEAQAKDQELVTAYRAAILSALVDVENALGALRHLDDAREFQIESVAQSERAFEGAKLRYQEGSGDYLAVLDAQRTLYTARDQFSQYKLARLQALVTLCKALGGGWT
jgi:outer membrane protein, multidrug efflux system